MSLSGIHGHRDWRRCLLAARRRAVRLVTPRRADESSSGPFGCRELFSDVAGEVDIGGFPFAGCGVFVNQVASSASICSSGSAIEFGDEIEIDATMLVERYKQPFLGLVTFVTGGVLADHVFGHNGGFGRLAGVSS